MWMQGRVLGAIVASVVVVLGGASNASAARLDASDALRFLSPFSAAKQGNGATFASGLLSSLSATICPESGTAPACVTITSRPAESTLLVGSNSYIVRWKVPTVIPARPFVIRIELKAIPGGAPIVLGSQSFWVGPSGGDRPAGATYVTHSRVADFYLDVARHPVVRARQHALYFVSATQAATTLHNEYTQLSTVADALQVGYALSATQVVRALVDGPKATYTAIAAALRGGLELDAPAITRALSGGGATLGQIATALKGIGETVAQVKALLQEELGAALDATLVALRAAGFTAAEVLSTFADGAYTPTEAAAALKRAGYAVADAAPALKQRYSLSPAQLGVVLRDGFGLDATGIARVLRDGGATLGEIAAALKAIGQDVQQVTDILFDEFDPDSDEVLVALREGGFTVKQVLTAWFSDAPTALGRLLDAGFPAWEVGQGIVERFDPTLAQLIAMVVGNIAQNPVSERLKRWDVIAGGFNFTLSVTDVVAAMRSYPADSVATTIEGGLEETAEDPRGLAQMTLYLKQDGRSLGEIAAVLKGSAYGFTYLEAARTLRYFSTADALRTLRLGYAEGDWRFAQALNQDIGFSIVDIVFPEPLCVGCGPPDLVDPRVMAQGWTEPPSLADQQQIIQYLRDLGLYETTGWVLFHLKVTLRDITTRMEPQFRERTDPIIEVLANAYGTQVAEAFRPVRMAAEAAVVLNSAVTYKLQLTDGGFVVSTTAPGNRDDMARVLRSVYDLHHKDLARIVHRVLGYNQDEVERALTQAGYTRSEVVVGVRAVYPDAFPSEPVDPEDQQGGHDDATFGNAGMLIHDPDLGHELNNL